jgi:SAM-dependent methyltransferase
MTPFAAYDPIASLYDQYWGDEFAEFAQDAFRTHLAEILPRPASVLDLCCGTGLLIAHLGALGNNVYGVDESSGMLEIAGKNAPDAHLQQADMAGFHWNARFDAVVCLYNSVNHTRSAEHLQAVMANVAAHLHPTGSFLFDYAALEAFESAWEMDEEIDTEHGPETIRYLYQRSARQATCSIDHRTEIRQIPLEPEEVHRALRLAGLVVIKEMPMAGPRPVAGRHLILARPA